MSQFTPRFQSSQPHHTQGREPEVKLRMTPGAHSPDKLDQTYSERGRQTASQQLKKLAFWDNTDAGRVEEDEWAEHHSPTPFILVIIVLVVISALIWFMFRWASGDHPSNPPIIPAESTPFKVRPENPGGMMIPHQDKLVYGRLSQNASQPVERLLPPPEQPMMQPPMAQPMGNPPQHPPYPQEQAYPAPQQAYGPPPPFEAVPPGVPSQSPSAAPVPPMYPSFPASEHPQQPHPYPPVQGQGQAMYPAAPSPSTSHGPSAIGAQPPGENLSPLPQTESMPAPSSDPVVNPTMTPQSAIEGVKPASDAEEERETLTQEAHQELNQLIAKEAENPLKRAPKKGSEEKLPKTTSIPATKYKVQIASLPSRAMAEQEMKRLHTNHGSFFAKKPWNIQKIDLGPDRGMTHRLIVGSFSDRAAATKFCKQLREEKIGCIVVAPANE